MATSCCPSVGFCIALCVVSVLNSQALQSEVCICVAKYKHLPFFGREDVLKRLFSDYCWLRAKGREMKILCSSLSSSSFKKRRRKESIFT